MAEEIRDFELEVDLDGVLVDFLGEYRKVMGKDFDFEDPDMTPREKWQELRVKAPGIYASAQPKADALELWNAIKHLKPSILTAVPSLVPFIRSTRDKRDWVKKHIQEGVNVKFAPYSVDKQYHCNGTSFHVLIDDSEKNCGQWSAKGGIAILHKSAEETIRILKELGILPS